MIRRTVAVIGHVDHGKTSLVHALTDIETDRLKEERERGLSITLGFAHRDYPSGGVDFIDTPGHEDFIRAMVSGATGARSVLLVVSAAEGIQRQTLEHLQIAALLGITTGVVAVTKADLSAPDQIAERTAEIACALADAGLAGLPIIACSARSGEGLDRLNAELEALLRHTTDTPGPGGVFLPVDRVFSVHGLGTVVTGTLLGGALQVGAEAVVQPSGRPVVVRGLQARGLDCATSEPGRRTAANLRGISLEAVKPGDVICAPGRFPSSRQVDVMLTLAATCLRPLRHMDTLRVMLGATSVIASARLLDGKAIAPGGAGLVQLRFPAPIVAFAGQRAILRRPSPAETIGGATILDPVAAPTGRKTPARLVVLAASARGDARQIAAALAARDGGVIALAEVQRLSRLDGPTLHARLAADFQPLGDALMAPRPAMIAVRAAYLAHLADSHLSNPLRPGVDVATLHRRLLPDVATALITHVEAILIAAGEVRRQKGQVALAGHDPLQALSPARRLALHRIETALRDAAVSPPDREDLCAADPGDHDLLTLLIDLDQAVPLINHAQRKTLVFHAEALTQARANLAAAFPQATAFTTGQARAALNTSRKFIVPILEHFDVMGWTLRTEDLRQIAEPLVVPDIR